MKKSKVNQGIIQSGGKIEANQIVVGRGAQAVSMSSESDGENRKLREELQKSVALLIQTLETHRNNLTNGPELLETAQSLEREVLAKKPNKLTATAILEGIAKAAGSVSAVGTAVEAIHKILALLH
jgi:hypothetical protein